MFDAPVCFGVLVVCMHLRIRIRMRAHKLVLRLHRIDQRYWHFSQAKSENNVRRGYQGGENFSTNREEDVVRSLLEVH